MMKKAEKIVSTALTLALAVSAFLFFRFSYWGHLHYLEEFQMFLFTREYLVETVAVPGGLSDYLGRFLTQFYLFPSAGAAIMALLLCAVQVLSYLASRRKGLGAYLFSFLPAACVWVYLVSDYCLVGTSVSIILALAALVLYRRYPNPMVLVVSAPLAYMVCGPLAIIFLLPAALDSPVLPAVTSLVLLVVCAFSGRFIWHFRPEAFFYGIHYKQYLLSFPTFAWVAGIGTVVYLVAEHFLTGLRKLSLAVPVAVFAGIIAALVTTIPKVCSDLDESLYRLDYYLTQRDWDGIVAFSRKNRTKNALLTSYIGTALAKTGLMGEELFRNFCQGPSSLLPQVLKHHTLSLPAAEVYWQAGLPNAALSVWFDSQEAVPDAQKSAFLSKRIAECNAVNGNIPVAERYLEPLRHTLFYSRWAESFNPDDEEYVPIRKWSEKVFDINAYDAGYIFYQQAKDYYDNEIAFAYCMSFNLLAKTLSNFLPIINLRQFNRLPALYQQAYLILHFQNKGTVDTVPSYIDAGITQRYMKYLSAVRRGDSAAVLSRKYGDTYWFYYDFIKLN